MGCRIEFRKTAADTHGELLEFDCFMEAGRVIARPHLHPLQTERFTVLAGRVYGRVAGRELAADTGDVVDVPPGTPHVWRADDSTEVHLRVEFRPAMQSERFLETVFGLARDRRCTANGTPRPLQAAVLLAGHPGEMWPVGVPVPLLQLFVAVCAPIGRLLGYRADYPRYFNMPTAVPADVGDSTQTSSPSQPLSRGPMPTRVMVFAKIKHGNEEAFESAFAEVTRKVKGTPGHITDELLRHSTGEDLMPGASPASETAADDGATHYILLSLWENREAFLAWERDTIHMQTTTPMRPYWAGRVERRIYDVAVRI